MSNTWAASEQWQEECRFWLPGDERVSYGRLNYAPQRGPGAHLMDSPLGDLARVETPEHLDVLFGETLGRTPFSLLNTWVVSHRRWLGAGNGNTVDVLGTSLVRGAHVGSLEDIKLTWAGLSLPGLLETLTGGVADQDRLFRVTARRDAREDLEAPVAGGTLLLHVGTSDSIRPHRSSVELRAGAGFRFADPLSLPEFDERFGAPLRDLIIFATAEPSWIETLHVADRSGLNERSPDELVAELRIVRAPSREPTPRTGGAYYALMLNLGSVADPSATLAAWFDLRERLGPVWPLFFSTLSRDELPLETQLLNLTAFAEGYHRTLHNNPPLGEKEHDQAVTAMLGALNESRQREVYRKALDHANSQTQRARIRWLTRRALDVLDAWQLDTRRFVSRVADTRNWLTHWGERGEDVQEGANLVVLLRQLEVVLRINIMCDLGLEDGEIAGQIGSGLRLAGLP